MGINVGDKYIIEIGAVAELPDGKKKYFIKPFESLVFDRKGLEQLKRFDNVADTLYQTGFKEGYTKAQARPDLKRLKDDSYNKGYEDGAKNQDEVQYKKGFEDGRAEATYNTDLIDELKQVEYIRGLEDANHAIDVLKNMTVEECEEWFEGHVGVGNVVCIFTIQQIIDNTNAYEEKKKAEEESLKVGDVVKFNEKCHNYDHVKSREFLVLHIFDNGLVTLLYDNGDTGASDKSLLDKTGKHIDEVEQLLDKLRGEDSD